ncbi:hypothetical protein B0B52_16710 [Polaromonas sp. A23]|nr:hypothetical protein B0B52_16710 [Polaromonas sp. A23]
MKCPHCSKSIGVFSRAANKWGKNKSCPYCEQPIKLYVSWKIAGLLFIPTIILALLLKPVFVSFGVSGSLATGLATGALILLSMRLKALPSTDA